MNLGKKDVVEFVGAVAILASLVFVGAQLQQSQNIAVAEGYETRVMAYLHKIYIEGYEAAEFEVKEFAAFLYQNPGARKVWDNRERSHHL